MKYLIICHNQHQLEKGLFFKKSYPEKIDVIITSNKVTKNINGYSKNFQYKEISQIIESVKNYQKFIFFSIQPKNNLIALIKKIRLQKKEIIAIQEAHQLSTHNKNICNILMSPDELWAASDLEKDIMISERLFQPEILRSHGWLFLNNYQNLLPLFTSELNNEGYILIIFAAPKNITASSHETYSKRDVILEFVNAKYTDKKILIKLHPQENKNFYMRYLSEKRVHSKNVEFANDVSNINHLANKASMIITSDSSQAFFDLLVGDNNLIIYQAGKKNFISDFLIKTYEYSELNGTFFYLINKEDERKNSFLERHLKSHSFKQENLKLFFDSSIKNDSYDFLFEVRLWEYIFQSKSGLKSWFKNFNSSLSQKIKIIDFYSEDSSIKIIEEISFNLSLRSAMTTIYIRENIKANNQLALQNKTFIQKYFTPSFVINFSLESLRLKYFYIKNSIRPPFKSEIEELLINIEENLIKKFKIFFIVTSLRNYLNKKNLTRAENALLGILIFFITKMIKIKNN